jgi:hypothetical protein
VLAFFGISLPVVQVGGGLIVIATGWSLLKQRDDEKQDVQKIVQPRRNPPGILSLDFATNRGPWINLSGAHAGRERGSSSRVPSCDNLGGTHWIGADRGQHFALLWICRPVGANPGANRNDGDHSIVVLLPGLYRCADRLERD